jgi:hypothetical protein
MIFLFGLMEKECPVQILLSLQPPRLTLARPYILSITSSAVARNTSDDSPFQDRLSMSAEREEDTYSVSSVASMSTTVQKGTASSESSCNHQSD